MDEILSQLSDVGDALSRSSNTNHGFSRMYGNTAYRIKLLDKVMKQVNRIRRLSIQEIVYGFIFCRGYWFTVHALCLVSMRCILLSRSKRFYWCGGV